MPLEIRDRDVVVHLDRMMQMRELDGLAVIVYFSGTQHVSPVKKKVVKRSPKENRKIAAIQANMGRDPWYLSRNELVAIRRITADMLVNVENGRTYDIHKSLGNVGRFIIRTFRSHVDKRTGYKGRIRRNKATYRRYKAKYYGETKPLVRTGMLLGGLRWRIGKVRRHG